MLFKYIGCDIMGRLNPLLHALRDTNQMNVVSKITAGLLINEHGDVVIDINELKGGPREQQQRTYKSCHESDATDYKPTGACYSSTNKSKNILTGLF